MIQTNAAARVSGHRSGYLPTVQWGPRNEVEKGESDVGDDKRSDDPIKWSVCYHSGDGGKAQTEGYDEIDERAGSSHQSSVQGPIFKVIAIDGDRLGPAHDESAAGRDVGGDQANKSEGLKVDDGIQSESTFVLGGGVT